MVEIDEVNEGDILEAVFYLESMNDDIRVAIDVDLVSDTVIYGEVLAVKNVPFDALESVTVRLDISKDEVKKNDHYGPVIGHDIELTSV